MIEGILIAGGLCCMLFAAWTVLCVGIKCMLKIADWIL